MFDIITKSKPYSYNKIEECIICLCDIQLKQYKSYCKNCKKFYHKDCLNKWWDKNKDSNKKCPYCQIDQTFIYKDCFVWCCFK